MSYALRPYLNFPGTTREVMEHYRSIFGGELALSTFAEFHAVPEGSDSAEKIMHSTLTTDHFVLYAADAIAEGPGVTYGTNVSLSLMGDGQEVLEELGAVMEKLGEGGEVTMPLAPQVWGDHFGAVTDRHGISWLVNVHVPGEVAPESV